MGGKVEFWFDIVSPASYLAWTQMPKLASETGAQILYRPFFLPGLFKTAGSSSPIAVPNKGRWMLNDLGAWARRYGVPFNMNRHFPLSSKSESIKSLSVSTLPLDGSRIFFRI